MARLARIPLGRQSAIVASDDREISRRLADGDPDALALLYDRHAPALFRMLTAMLRSGTDAEDVLQEIFVKLANGKAERVKDWKSYLFGAARNEAINLLRKRGREEQLDESGLENTPAPETSNSGPDWTALLARLPLEQREVIALKVWEEMTFAEIAVIVKASPNTVMSRYRYGIERLRQWCREESHD